MTDALIMYVDGLRSRVSGDVVLSLSVDASNAHLVAGFVSKIGKPVGVAFSDVDPAPVKSGKKPTPKKEPTPYGQQAKALKLSGFFRSPEVWKAIGTDKAFREWVTFQKSVIDGNQDWDERSGEGRCVAAHVRRAGESGTGHKAEYACVPLTTEQHQDQHDAGEAHCLDRYGIDRSESGDPMNAEQAQSWFDKARIRTVESWAWESVKLQLGIDSFSTEPPETLVKWADEHGLRKYLPESYR